MKNPKRQHSRRASSAKRTAGSLKRVVSYDEAKNLKHLKDAHGHLMHFDGGGLSEWNRSLVDVARHNLGEAIQRICGK